MSLHPADQECFRCYMDECRPHRAGCRRARYLEIHRGMDHREAEKCMTDGMHYQHSCGVAIFEEDE